MQAAKIRTPTSSLGQSPKDTEGIRAKLKRLVKRDVLIESQLGSSP
jgi:hypothetical protein